MPELPEVETVRRTLEPAVLGRRIAAVAIHHRHVTGPLPARRFTAAVTGRSIAATSRKGKYLVFELRPQQGPAARGWPDPLYLICHLRMTGRLCYLPPRARWPERAEHTHATFRLLGGGRVIFHDVRKFGRFVLAGPDELPALLPAGRDPVNDGLDAAALAPLLAGRAGSLKALLLRQDLLCGLGNIYADEALHRAGLHPGRAAGSLGAADVIRLAEGITRVLGEALAFRGTTLLDYRTGDGERGAFARYLRVYGRGGRPCRSCATPIATTRLAGRTTAFCPRCQPA